MKSMILKSANNLSGKVIVPGDKSISHRAVMAAALARGRTTVTNLLDCDDCNYTIGAFKAMGVDIKKENGSTVIEGKGLRGLSAPGKDLDMGSSGTSMRLLAGILAGQSFSATLTADKYLSARPMKRIIEPLSMMGVDIKGAAGGYPPLRIKGGMVNPICYTMPIPSAQVKSAILFAGLYADGTTIVEEEFKSRDHTERMLKYFGANIWVDGLEVSVVGGGKLSARSLEIPGDISSASFFMAGAILLKGSGIMIEKVGINPTRAGILNLLKKMGAKFTISDKSDLFEPVGDIEVGSSDGLYGVSIEEGEIPAMIDELPVIFVLASLAKGRTVIKGAGELKVKETNRIKSMVTNLSLMGAKIHEDKDAIVIDGVDELKGSERLKSYGDHRTCMATVIAALAAKGDSRIDDAECVSKSFPQFFEVLERLYCR